MYFVGHFFWGTLYRNAFDRIDLEGLKGDGMPQKTMATILEQVDDIAKVKRESAHGAISVFLGQVVSLLINIGSLSILARLLEPAHFGLIGMIMAIANLASIFQDLGFSMATVQRREISHEQVSSLFWLNTLFGSIIMIVLSLMAPLISAFYGHHELRWLTILISTAFFFSGMSVQHQALLRRRMQFGRLAILRCVSLFISHCLAVLFAILGGSIWSLAAMQVLTPVFMFFGCFIAMPWIPSFPRRETPVRELVGFGLNVAGFGIITYFARNLDKILIGHAFGSSALGFYNKAYELMLLPLTRLRGPIIGVASPALSGLQNNIHAYRSYYLNFIALLSLVTFPLITCLILLAPNIILIVLGQDWIATTVLFRWLGIAAVVQPFNWALGILLVSLGRTRRYLIWGIAYSVIIVLSFLVGLRWGVNGVAAAYAVANIALFLPSILFCVRKTYLKAFEFLSPMLYPLMGTVFSVWVAVMLRHQFGAISTIIDLLLTGSSFLAFYCFFIITVPQTRTILIGMARLMRNMIPC